MDQRKLQRALSKIEEITNDSAIDGVMSVRDGLTIDRFISILKTCNKIAKNPEQEEPCSKQLRLEISHDSLLRFTNI